MRLPRVRFTVRRMMVAVAVAAAILCVVERRERFRRISLGHELEKNKIVGDLELYLVATVEPHESDEHAAERLRAARPLIRFNEYQDQMRDKYELAASRPWLPIASDPPPPPKPSREYFRSVYIRFNGPPYDLDMPTPK